jgi:hypothetical protein
MASLLYRFGTVVWAHLQHCETGLTPCLCHLPHSVYFRAGTVQCRLAGNDAGNLRGIVRHDLAKKQVLECPQSLGALQVVVLLERLKEIRVRCFEIPLLCIEDPTLQINLRLQAVSEYVPGRTSSTKARSHHTKHKLTLRRRVSHTHRA